MVNKLIENIDNQVWLEFTSICRSDGILVGNRLNDILKEHNKEIMKAKHESRESKQIPSNTQVNGLYDGDK